MIAPETTGFEGLIQQEHDIAGEALSKYGDAYLLARQSTILLSQLLESVSNTREVFGRFFSIAKKHHTLALIAFIRRHQTQGMWNLRVVTEAISNAVYALEHPDASIVDAVTGLALGHQRITDRSYKWIEEAFPRHSAGLKDLKASINSNHAHANIVNSEMIFSVVEGESTWRMSFFDDEDEYLMLMSLHLTIAVAMCVAHLIHAASGSVGGCVFNRAVVPELAQLEEDRMRLRDYMMQQPRYAAAAAALAEAEKAKADAAR